MSVLKGCKPREEVLRGDLNDAIFAADFGNLIAGTVPKVYKDARTFFQNTHPAQQLCRVVQAVFARLADSKEPGAVLRLSTGFGGGKTHTLMALWHLAQYLGDASMGTELLPAAGRPKSVTIAALDLSKAGLPEFARHGSTRAHSLWGELFFQLGDEKGLKSLGKADDPELSPSEAQIEAVLPKGPLLILLDELVVYMAKLSDRAQGNFLGFINSLSSVATKRPQTILIVTDPADQRAYQQQTAQFNAQLAAAATKLDDVLGRRSSDFDPIGDEAARVIVRRLFEAVDPTAAEKASAAYHDLYQRVARDHSGLIPAAATGPDYAKRIRECYPFHPRLLDTAQDRLGALQEFNKSRGTLRLFARILRSVWEAKLEADLIAAGDVDWSSTGVRADLLQRLNRDNFSSAVSADVNKHAGELDGENARGIHRRVASALLLESIPMQSNSGLDPAEVTLATLRPDEGGHEPSEALDRLAGVCWHTYPMPGGRGWQFRYEPNIVKQIEERMGDVAVEDAKSRVFAEVQDYFSGPTFRVSAWPQRASQVTESAELQLALCENEKLARSICANSDDSDPKAPLPRRFQNAVLAVTSTSSSLTNATERAQRLMAAEAIEREHKSGEAGALVREQLRKVLPELRKQFGVQSRRAFDRVVLAGGQSFALDEKYFAPDEQILQRPHGQGSLKRFLDDKGLIYQDGEALDTHKFLKDVLPGAVPAAGQPDAFTAKAVHERMLAAPGLRLVPSGSIVRQTLLKALEQGKVVIRLADDRTYDDKGCVEGPPGHRRRGSGTLSTFALDDSVKVATAGAAAAGEWLKTDEQGPSAGQPPPPPPAPSRVEAITWDQIVVMAKDRPLLELRLTATTPAAAAALPGLIQALGADRLSLSLNVGGSLKDGGNVNFAASDVKLNHAIKPLALAQTLFNALTEGGLFEAILTLAFGSGRAGLADALRAVADSAPGEISPRATFDKPTGKA